MIGLREDLRISWRRLAARPAASAAAILALALGIGFSTANYSVADAILFHPLPVPDIDRVVVIGLRLEASPDDFRSVPPADFSLWTSSSRTFQSIAADRRWFATFTGSGEPLQVQGALVNAAFFDVMQLRPALGRFFTAEEEHPGHDNSIVLNYHLWERQFAADPAIVGRTVQLSGRSFTVCGVLPKGLNFPRGAEFLAPLAWEPGAWADSSSFVLHVTARLRDGASLPQARAEFDSFTRASAAQYPATHSHVTANLVPLRERASGGHAAGYIRILIAAVLFLVLIACLNVANLQLARILARGREMAVRAALGASRLRIARQVLVESLLLSAAGALLGVLTASWALDYIRALIPPEFIRFLPGWSSLGLNRWVLTWTALTAAAAGILSALAPVAWLNRASLAPSLHESGRSSTTGTTRGRLRTSLVVFETSLAVVLLIGAAVMVRSFGAIDGLDVSNDPRQALTFRLSLPESRYPGSAAAARFQNDLLTRLQALPGVRGAAIVSNLPGSGSANSAFVTVEGRPAERGPGAVSQAQSISPSYFHTLGLPLVEGRAFNPSDGRDTAQVAIVSQAFARRFFPAASPLGRRVHLGDGNWLTIVGLAADVLHDYGDRHPLPLVYRPTAQFTWNSFDALLATSGDPSSLAPAVRRAVHDTDAAQPVYLLRSFDRLLRDNTFGIAFVASILAALGAVALFLSLLGVYSVMACVVAERTREFGVRLALGARRASLLWLVLRSGLLIAAASLLLGLPAAFAVLHLLRGFIFGVSPYDLSVFAGVPALLAAALAAACLLPAWRATRTDPITALRYE